jgi:uncharacterized protein YidB (DUF937 family)
MGILDDLESKALSGVLGGSSSPLAAGLLQMINNHPGGLPALLQSFHDKGLGDIVSSWVGTGQNLPISAEQVQQVFGNDQLKALAAKAGITSGVAGSSLAQLLPVLIDKLTPNGQVPQQASLLETGMNLLNSLGKTGTTG